MSTQINYPGDASLAQSSSSQPTIRTVTTEENTASLDDTVRSVIKGKMLDIFGFDEYKNNQEVAVCNFVLGNDVLLISPTGSGKSLCYFLPSIMGSWEGTTFNRNGFTLVISPLISLIEDQMLKLKDWKINALALAGQMTPKQQEHKLDYMLGGSPKVIFVTPEKLKNKVVFDKLATASLRKLLRRIVIDECHCISMWGHDFRKDYLDLGVLRTRLSQYYRDLLPLMAVTATLTPLAEKDVREHLWKHQKQPVRISGTFQRSNISYNVTEKNADTAVEKTKACMERHPEGSGIVYCATKKEAKDFAAKLNKEGVGACYYHGRLGGAVKKEAQKKWLENEVKVICATIALGMGIDKPDVRFVIHASLPWSIENFYQETGRAGRDGKPSETWLCYDHHDMDKLRRMVDGQRRTMKTRALMLNNISKMERFAISEDKCRMDMILRHFKEQHATGQCTTNICDNCETAKTQWPTLMDITTFTRDASAAVIHGLHIAQQQGMLRCPTLSAILRGDRSSLDKVCKSNSPDKFPCWKKYQGISKKDLCFLIRVLVTQGFLEEHMYRASLYVEAMPMLYLKIGQKSTQLNNDDCKVVTWTTRERLKEYFDATNTFKNKAVITNAQAYDCDELRKRAFITQWRVTEEQVMNVVCALPLTVKDVRAVCQSKNMHPAPCRSIIVFVKQMIERGRKSDEDKESDEFVAELEQMDPTAIWDGMIIMQPYFD